MNTQLSVIVREGYEDDCLARTFKASPDQAEYLLKVACEALSQYSEDWRYPNGIDGIGAQGSFTSELIKLDDFSFWSPRCNQPPYYLVKALFDLVNPQELDDKFNTYYEQLSWYFDFGIPVRVIESNPKRLRIYCGLSSTMEKDLRRAIKQIKPEEPLIVDMSNFDFMGILLCPVFRPLIERPGKTRWIASKRAMPYLKMMQVPTQLIEPTGG
jgi:hypothetical protein